MNKLPEKLTLLRKHEQYSQGDVAQKLNIPVTEYMKWENGNDICSIQQLKQLADLYHVSLDVLADNAKELVIPKDSLEDSVDIPFMNGQDINMTQEMDPADNMMPVDGVLPPAEGDTIQMNSANPDDTDLGSTRVMDTKQFAEGPQDDTDDTSYVEEPKKKSKGSAKDKKKKQSIIIIASVCAAVVLLGIILLVVSANRSRVSPGEDNRLAVGDTYSLYVDASGNLKTYGTFKPSSSFDGAAQVSAFDNHAAALLKSGKAVSSDGNKTVAGWEDLTYIAAGKDHTAAVKNDGKVVCAGNKNACQVGDWKNMKKVYAGDGFTIGLTNDGDVKVSGSKANAVKNQSDVSDVAISDNLIILVKKNGKVSSYLSGSGEPISTGSWSNVEKAAAGDSLAAGLKKNGTVEIEYSDEDVKAKVGEWKNIHYLAANGSTIVAIDRSGNMHGAGDNSHHQYRESSDSKSKPSASSDNALNKPSNITVSATTANVVIKWNSVKNAGSYLVSISSVGDLPETTTNQASVAATSLVSGNTYTITVTAVPKNEKKYKESSASIGYTYQPKTLKLDTPGDITSRAENGGWTISWSNVDHADYYGLSINGAPEQRVNTNSMSIDDIEPGTYSISVKAYSANSTYTESDAGTATVNLQYADRTYTVSFQTKDRSVVLPPLSGIKLTPGKSYSADQILQACGGQSIIGNHTISSNQDSIVPSTDPDQNVVTVIIDD